MKHIIALGNPEEHSGTNHNIGKDLLKKYLSLKGAPLDRKNKIHSSSLKGIQFLYFDGGMNTIGEDLKHLLITLDPNDVMIIHDEILLEIGTVKLKKGFGNSTHNGVKSIKNILGSDFYRIRIGIDREDPLIEHVHAKVSDTNYKKIEKEFLTQMEFFLEKFINS